MQWDDDDIKRIYNWLDHTNRSIVDASEECEGETYVRLNVKVIIIRTNTREENIFWFFFANEKDNFSNGDHSKRMNMTTKRMAELGAFFITFGNMRNASHFLCHLHNNCFTLQCNQRSQIIPYGIHIVLQITFT